jgi:hypothetical protein
VGINSSANLDLIPRRKELIAGRRGWSGKDDVVELRAVGR